MAIPAWALQIIETVTYAAAKGCVRAYLDVMREPREVIDEADANSNPVLGPGHAAALAEWMSQQSEIDTGPDYSPQDQPKGYGLDQDAETERLASGD